MRTFILALLIIVVAGCSKEDPGPSCEKVTDHLFEVAKKAYAGHGDMAMGNRKAEIENCQKRNLPAAERRCILAATDLAGVAKCRPSPAPQPGAQPAAKP